jgi:hypothetical protein
VNLLRPGFEPPTRDEMAWIQAGFISATDLNAVASMTPRAVWL